MPPNPADQRRAPRHDVDLDVFVEFLKPGDVSGAVQPAGGLRNSTGEIWFIQGKIQNLSLLGALIHAPAPSRTDYSRMLTGKTTRDVRLHFAFPHQEGLRSRLFARIAWLDYRDEPPRHLRLGVAFQEMTPAEREALNGFLRHLSMRETL